MQQTNGATAGRAVRHYSGPEAAHLAGVSYRQLDYWARRRWIVPSLPGQEGVRRCYSPADVVRLAALGHLGRSRVDVAAYAEATGRLRIPAGCGFVIVWGIHDSSVRLVLSDDVCRTAGRPGRYVIFDPEPVLHKLVGNGQDEAAGRARRRIFTPEYKMRVLAEYDGLTQPGAKGAMLQAEGLHSSHLVAWRRSRAAGELALRPPGEKRPVPGSPVD